MEDEQVIPSSWTTEQIRAANKYIDDRMDAVAGSHYGRCRVNDNGTVSHGGAHGDHECPAIQMTARAMEHYGWGKDQVGSLPMQPPPDFQKELLALINVYSQENASQTPDFILASYLQACLDTWNLHTRERDRWFGNRSLFGPGIGDGAFPPVPTSEKSLLP